MLHRAALQQVLIDRLEALAPGALRSGAAVIGFELGDGRVTLHMGDCRSAEGDVLVAAIGVKSMLHETIVGPDRPV